MIYNLQSYLKLQLTTLDIVLFGWGKDSPEECISIKPTGGLPSKYSLKDIQSVQIMSRAADVNVARSNIYLIFDKLYNRFGLVLPEVTVGDTVFPEVKTYQITPIQDPGYLGSDGSNLEMWSFNTMITI